MSNDLSTLLNEATVQEIQLELIRRTQFNAFDGKRIVATLQRRRELWEAVFLDRDGSHGQQRIKLRDLPYNYWNADCLYILAPNERSAEEIVRIAEEDDWGGEPSIWQDRVRTPETGKAERVVVSFWWD